MFGMLNAFGNMGDIVEKNKDMLEQLPENLKKLFDFIEWQTGLLRKIEEDVAQARANTEAILLALRPVTAPDPSAVALAASFSKSDPRAKIPTEV